MKLLITGGAGFIGSNLIHHVIDRPEIAKLVNLDCLTYAGHWKIWKRFPNTRNTFLRRWTCATKRRAGGRRKHAVTHVMHLARNRTWTVPSPVRAISSTRMSSAHLICSKPAAPAGSQLSTPMNREQALNAQPASASIMFRPMKLWFAWPDRIFSRRRRLTRQTHRIPRARHRPTCWCGRTTTLTACRRHQNCSNNYGPYQFPEKLIPV